jgi:hypothetical protein
MGLAMMSALRQGRTTSPQIGVSGPCIPVLAVAPSLSHQPRSLEIEIAPTHHSLFCMLAFLLSSACLSLSITYAPLQIYFYSNIQLLANLAHYSLSLLSLHLGLTPFVSPQYLQREILC